MSLINYTYTPGFKNQEFHHIVFSVSGTTHTFYLDGVRVAQNLSGGNIFDYYQTITNTVIGAQTALSQAFQGTIGDVRVYNYVIPQNTVTNLYRDRELVVYYPFDTSVNSLTPNYATLIYDASLIGQPLITASSDTNVGSGALSLTNSSTSTATQYVKTTPGIQGQIGWKLDVTQGLTIAGWINVAGIDGNIQRIFDIQYQVGMPGLAIDISGTNMIYSVWNLPTLPPPIDSLSSTAKTAMLGTGKQAGAYGVYLLYSNYTGPIIQIKNGSSGTATDFYADIYGNLSTSGGTSLKVFLEGQIPYITIWYDQTGNTRHGTAVNTPIYDTNNRTVNFASGYFRLLDSSFPTGNSPYTYIFTPNNYTITPTKSQVIFSGGSHGNYQDCAGLFASGGARYTNFWYNSSWITSYNIGTMNGIKIADTYSGGTGLNRRFYFDNALDTRAGHSQTVTARNQGTGNCFLGHIGETYNGGGSILDYNGTLRFFYWAPVLLTVSDLTILGNS